MTHNIKFIAVDMDGTLLDENSQLPPDFYEIYQKLLDHKVMFAAASGRQYYSLLQTFEPIAESMYFIAENGTMVMHKDQELYSCTIPNADIVNIVKKVRRIAGAHIVLCGKSSAYVETQCDKALAEISKYYHRCENVSDILAVKDEFIKVAICHFEGSEKLVYPEIYREFGETHQVVISAKIWLDVMNAEASKGAAMQHLQDTLGFSFDETMSFGDYLNDLEMLKASYHSYAMENAHPTIKSQARFLAPSNVEHGVTTVIRELLSRL